MAVLISEPGQAAAGHVNASPVRALLCVCMNWGHMCELVFTCIVSVTKRE